METQQQPSPGRRTHRLIAGLGAVLLSAGVVAIQIPAVREAVGLARITYHFIDSTVPSLGVAAIWIGVVLLGGGMALAVWLHRVLKDGTGKTLAVGSAGLAVMLGVLVAVVSSLNQPQSQRVAPHNYEAKVVTKHHRTHRHHHQAPRHHSAGTPAAKPAPASTGSAPAPAPSSGGSSSSGGSGGNGNTVIVSKHNQQEATTGNAEGTNAHSGDATNENNEGPVNISIG